MKKMMIGLAALIGLCAAAYAGGLDEVFSDYYANSASVATADFAGAEFALSDTGESKPLMPVVAKAGTGMETRVGVDMAAANEISDGWPWYAKAGLVVGCVAVAGLATWAVLDACDGGRHDNDSSQRLMLDVGGEGNSVTIHYHTDEPCNTTTTTGR